MDDFGNAEYQIGHRIKFEARQSVLQGHLRTVFDIDSRLEALHHLKTLYATTAKLAKPYNQMSLFGRFIVADMVCYCRFVLTTPYRHSQ